MNRQVRAADKTGKGGGRKRDRYGRWLVRKQREATARVVPQRKSVVGVPAIPTDLVAATPLCCLPPGTTGGGLCGGGGGGTRSEVEEGRLQVTVTTAHPPRRRIRRGSGS
ncbi:hypothetical protein Pcinc_011191 [Petrolisthes cinctipes]|uniref:Uncharacterized protein n=1 Tax=Petrolisthes cinctipes TaxID=88211 RepID=A0AAE1G1A7_PETCI|nr:hypothetical protein Pcinc_011191 [Petrolisthes cinctipes]